MALLSRTSRADHPGLWSPNSTRTCCASADRPLGPRLAGRRTQARVVPLEPLRRHKDGVQARKDRVVGLGEKVVRGQRPVLSEGRTTTRSASAAKGCRARARSPSRRSCRATRRAARHPRAPRAGRAPGCTGALQPRESAIAVGGRVLVTEPCSAHSLHPGACSTSQGIARTGGELL
jgi:hypothetical protein